MSGDYNDSGWRKRQIALDIKAENARELGLDYEPSKTIEMARSCGINFHQAGWPELERLVELVRADERNRTWTLSEWTEYERSIAAAEREACAKVCEQHGYDHYCGNVTDKIAETIRARGTTPPAAQPAQEPDAYGYARRLAEYIWAAHYRVTAPQWKPFDDLMGVLTQIDNMTSGLVTPPAAQPKQERNFCPRCGKRVGDYIHTCTPPKEKYTYGTPLMDAMTQDYVPPQRPWVGLTEDERINISYKADGNECVAVELTEAKLKERNL
jgi:hypothetical protein